MKRILRALGLKKIKHKFEFDVDLTEALDALAQEEQRAPEALAADLLAQAVESKQQMVENIDCGKGYRRGRRKWWRWCAVGI